MLHRLAMCALTAPTAAVFNCLTGVPDKIDTGAKLRFFGDGHQSERELDGRTIVVIPVMSGEFLVEKEFGIAKGVAGGNFIIMAQNSGAALNAGESAVGAIRRVRGTITPFPGGVCGSGSKVGSKYKFMVASTNETFCPTLRGKVESELPEGVNSVTEIVIDGSSPEAVGEAMRRGILAASTVPGVVAITAGNYGGKLGEHRFDLHGLLKD
jgi:formylmethanofuran--tetrahydromethanopterin N-formyltransferase